MRYLVGPTLLIAVLLTFGVSIAFAEAAFARKMQPRPVVVLVHGAFAEPSSWSKVIDLLNKDGYRTIAAPNPLRSVAGDASSIAALVRSVHGPVILVGHSYGGSVITEAAASAPNVKRLVYVAAFAPEVGESAATLSSKYPGSSLGPALVSIATPTGGQDLYVDTGKYHGQFAADLSIADAEMMAATQRPIAKTALVETSRVASWKKIPSFAIYGSEDRNIPAAVLKFMATRANARKVVVVKGASHALMLSHPDQVAGLIEDAATDETWAESLR